MGNGEVGLNNLTGPLKVLLLLLSILGIVVPSVLGWVNFDTRIDRVEEDQTRNNIEQKQKFAKHEAYEKEELSALKKTNENQDLRIVSLEKREIQRNADFNMLRQDLKRTEAKLDLILSELKGWEGKPNGG